MAWVRRGTRFDLKGKFIFRGDLQATLGVKDLWGDSVLSMHGLKIEWGLIWTRGEEDLQSLLD